MRNARLSILILLLTISTSCNLNTNINLLDQYSEPASPTKNFEDSINSSAKSVTVSEPVMVSGLTAASSISVTGTGGALPYDISQIKLTDPNSLGIGKQELSVKATGFMPGGKRLFALGLSSDGIHQYNLNTAYDCSTAEFHFRYKISQDGGPSSFAFNSSGNKIIVSGSSSANLYQYSLGNPYDVNTMSYDNITASISSQVATLNSIRFNNDGSKMFALDGATQIIHEYSLSAYDITTLSQP